jgi:hypothetical protein
MSKFGSMDPRREVLDIEAAIGDALAPNTRLGHHLTVTAGPDGLVALTGDRVDAEPAGGGRAHLLDGVRGLESARQPDSWSLTSAQQS